MNKQRLIKLLEDLVKIPSFSGQENDAMIYCKDYIVNNIGIEPIFDESFKIDGEKKYSNVELWLGKEPKLILNGHLDVVSIEEKMWKVTKPFEPKIIGNELYGRGSVDTKGSTCAAIEAITSLIELGNEIDGLLLVLESDEETHFSGAKRFIEKYKNKLSPELLVFTEPSDNRIINEQKGLYHTKISTKTVKEKYTHASLAQIWENGKPVVTSENAIDKMIPVLNRLMKFKKRMLKLKPDEKQGGVSFNVGIINGGTAPNNIAFDCYVTIDSRIPINRGAEKIAKQLKQYMEAKNKDGKRYCECDIKLGSIREAIKIPEETPSVEKFKNCVKESLGKIEFGVIFAYTELEMYSRDLNPGKEIPAITFGAGPMDNCHNPDEYVNLDMLFNAEKVYENVIKRFCIKN